MFFIIRKKDNVLGQHETTLSETTTSKKFAMSPQTVFAFAI